MKAVISFRSAVKFLRGSPCLRINELDIYEREAVTFYGLPSEYTEILLKEITGAYIPDEGEVTVLGIEDRESVDEKSWFQLVQNIGIYNAQPVFQESASIGENVAMLYRLRDGTMDEPQLSASVLSLANLVGLTITDLSRMMNEATGMQRMKVRLSRALAYHPEIVLLCDPTAGMESEVARKFMDLLKHARRKLKFTMVLFTSDIVLVEELADRVLFLNPVDGFFIENELRGWYHKLLPFMDPSPAQLLQLSRDVLQHNRLIRITNERLSNQP